MELNKEIVSHPDIQEGDVVFVKATVNRIPKKGTNLYRLITADEGSVLWCTREEIFTKDKRG